MRAGAPRRPRLVLASASPRRSELLRSRGIDFVVTPSDIPEVPRPDESPAVFAERMARDKARAVAQTLESVSWVLGADTIVTIDGDILGKPCDIREAQTMLRRLSGRVHQVMTGVALIAPDGSVASSLCVTTDVEMRTLNVAEIEAYVESGEPMDKAGAYAIQGGAAVFIVQVAGSYSNVVGLPLDEVCALLERHELTSRQTEASR